MLGRMKDIEPLSEYGVIRDTDVARTLNGLHKGARYAASDLYERYVASVKADGRSPGHPVALGQVFKRLGMERVKMTVGGGGRGRTGKGQQVSAWVV